MSTTLHERPPQSVAEQPLTSHRSVSRPTALDRLALRVGLLLVTYGRRRYATRRDLAKVERARHEVRVAHARRQSDLARVERELSWARARWVQRPNV
jgi:hypothetical protein